METRPKTQKAQRSQDQKTTTADKRTKEKTAKQGEVKLHRLELMLDRTKLGFPPIYTMDLETDPFLKGRVPVPFVGGLFDGITFKAIWSDHRRTCLEKLRAMFEDGELEPGIVFMHNGGRFDFFYMLDWFEGKAMIVGSRLVRAFMLLQIHKKKKWQERFEFRDSYAIMPFPLKAYKKRSLKLEYLSREKRNHHKKKITYYLEGDCVYLWDLCMEFHHEFEGDYKTIASAAFAQLTSFHKYEQFHTDEDGIIRSKFYYGGRVQCFEKGLIETKVQIYDVNSMYPYVMDKFFHPTGWMVVKDTQLHGWKSNGTFSDEKLKTFFLTVEGRNDGAFPQRQKNGGVDFTERVGMFHVTIHEYFAALQLGLFSGRILETFNFSEYSRFHLFVDHFYRLREKAKAAGDEMHSLFYKYILNSAYGKFGLNPDNYFNWQITRTAESPKGNFWQLDTIQQGKYYVWKQPNQLSWNFKNIGTAASITGAARSVLLRTIATSGRVLYCDTDSIICKGFAGGEIDSKKLGAWKLEAEGMYTAIAGKKMYAVFAADGTCVKHANKGVDLKPQDILKLCMGEEILTERDAPTFKRDGSALFIHRTVRMTA